MLPITQKENWGVNPTNTKRSGGRQQKILNKKTAGRKRRDVYKPKKNICAQTQRFTGSSTFLTLQKIKKSTNGFSKTDSFFHLCIPPMKGTV
jgi:hypothetical protein